MDYTWNWIVGALTIFASGSVEPRRGIDNDLGLVESDREDVDALIVAGNMLVLLEAKCTKTGTQSGFTRRCGD
jgi:hypothetical protein